MLAKGNPEFCAILVAVNSVLQIVLYAPFALFYLQVKRTALRLSRAPSHKLFWPEVCSAAARLLDMANSLQQQGASRS